ncbi:MAG: DUF4235 domain-containing protein [Propionibacteriaceae bacterium]|jgi:hypothetical protein|nr:DUF4235 domain-containing protein [Propionibacteriaceae bacterium]
MERVVERIYTAILSALVTFAVSLVIKKAWTAVTGNQPPNANDPEVPTRQAVSWFLASGIGLGVAQLLFHRGMTKRLSARVPSRLG